MNRVVLVGRITKDPELRNSPSGVAFCSFSIAVNRNVPNAQGERVADFINCVVFNKQAENLARYVKKGALIGCEGKLQSRSYQAQDGSNRTTYDVVCDSITFLANAQNSGNSQNQSAYNDYSSYSENFNQEYQPQQQNQQQRSYSRPVQQPQPVPQAQPVQPAPEPKKNNFEDVEKQYDLSDDELPF